MSIALFTPADPESPKRVILKDPRTDEETKYWVDMYGPESKVAQAHDAKIGQATIDRLYKRKTSVPKFEDESRKAVEKMAACGAGWNLEDDQGQPIEFSKDAFQKALENSASLRSQVRAFFDDLGNFY